MNATTEMLTWFGAMLLLQSLELEGNDETALADGIRDLADEAWKCLDSDQRLVAGQINVKLQTKGMAPVHPHLKVHS